MEKMQEKPEFRTVKVGSIEIGKPGLPVLIAGPCVIESEGHAMEMADLIAGIAGYRGFQYIFKSSYDKANRSSIDSYRGPGIRTGLSVLRRIRESTGVPVLTDIHDIHQIEPACGVVDIIQVPAFLCRQTDLYIEAGKYGKPVNIKKGQFMSPLDMKNVVAKASGCGIREILLTERGVSFGYNRLVVDFISLPVMRALGVPVVFDVTHSLQLPGAGGTYTAGNREYAPFLARAAVAVGCDALFLEVHDDPEHALSDGSNMITPDVLDEILRQVKSIRTALDESGGE